MANRAQVRAVRYVKCLYELDFASSRRCEWAQVRANARDEESGSERGRTRVDDMPQRVLAVLRHSGCDAVKIVRFASREAQIRSTSGSFGTLSSRRSRLD